MRRTLTFVLMLIFTGTLAQAQSVQELVDRYDRSYASGRYELALKTAEQIIELYPDSAWWQFNTGSVLAKLDRVDESIEHLGRAAELGFSGVRSLEQNTDLDSVRGDPRFDPIVERVRANAAERMGAFQEEARKHEPLIFVPEGTGGDQTRALIIALHGTGGNGQSMHDMLLETAEQLGMILVSPDALRPSGSGFSWTYRDESEWFIEHLIDWAVEEHHADRSRVYLVGFSQGANIALIMGQTRPGLFRGVIPYCGHYEANVVEPEGVPAPFYLMTGARDDWRQTYVQAKRDFVDAGGQAEVRLLPGLGHELPRGWSALREFKKAFLWFDRVHDAAENAP